MSLIHQALKKLDGTRGGYTTTALRHGSVRPPGRTLAKRVIVAGLLMSTAIAVALFSSYAYRTYYISDTAALDRQPSAAAGSGPSGDAVQSAAELNRKGVYLYRTGSYSQAAAEFKSALTEAPDDPVLHNNLGLAYMREAKTIKAEEHFKRAIELRPDYPEALNNHAMLLSAGGRDTEALKLLERAVKIAPRYPDAVLNTATILERKSRRTEAVKYYERYLALGVQNGQAMAVRKKIALLRAAIILGKE